MTESDPIYRLASEMIALGIEDIRHKPVKNLHQMRDIDRHRGEALVWFGKRSTSVGGYGWCLQVTRLNPNFIRRGINSIIGGKIESRTYTKGSLKRGEPAMRCQARLEFIGDPREETLERVQPVHQGEGGVRMRGSPEDTDFQDTQSEEMRWADASLPQGLAEEWEIEV